MYCPNCNLQYPEDALFCNVCGCALASSYAQETPMQDTAQYEYYENVYYAPKKPKRFLKKFLLIALPCALVLGLVAGLLYYFLVYSHPLNQLSRSADNTLAALMDNAPTMLNVYENMSEFLNEREFSAELDVTSSGEWGDGDRNEGSVKLELSYDADGEELSGGVSYESLSEYYGETYSDSVKVDFSADDKDLYIYSKEMGKEVYTLPLADFGKEYQESELSDLIDDRTADRILESLSINLFSDAGLDSFLTDTDEGAQFMDSMQIEEVDKSIPYAPEDLTVFRAKIDSDDLVDAFVAYSKYSMADLLGEEAAEELALLESYDYDMDEQTVFIYWGINDDNCLAAIYAYPKGDEDEAVGFVLAGEENIWDDVIILDGDDTVEFSVKQKSDGFELYREYEGRSSQKLLKCDDRKGEIVIYDGNDEYVIEYSDENDGARFTYTYSDYDISDYDSDYDYSEKIHVEVSFAPVENIKMLDGETVAVLDLSERKIEELLEDIS